MKRIHETIPITAIIMISSVAVAIILAFLIVPGADSQQITAIPGKMVPLNSSLTLKFDTGQDSWFSCFWYRKEDYCMFAQGQYDSPAALNYATHLIETK